MTLEEIYDGDTLKECIKIAFKDDNELLERYHWLSGSSLEDCVRDTYNKIMDVSKFETLDWYMVLDDEGHNIGFLVVSKFLKILYSFGLNIDSRFKYKEVFFDEICDLFEREFSCLLWTKNKRAINFLERMGMDIVDELDDYTFLKLCQ